MNKKTLSNNYPNYYNINQNNTLKKNVNKAQNLPKRNFQYNQSQKKSMPVNYMQFNNDIYNDNINNTFDGFKIEDTNFSGLPTNYNYGNHRVFNSNLINDKNRANKEEEIQGSFIQLQNKINQIKNILSKVGPKYDMEDMNKRASFEFNIDSNPININFNNKYRPRTYNSRFNPNSNLIKNNNNNMNINARKDLNRIHNQMQNKNPKASLIKKMTQFHINDNNINNNNQNLSRKIINNNRFMAQQNNFNNNNINVNFINNRNNNTNFNKISNQVDFNNENKLTNFDINKYPHEIQQIKEIDSLDLNLGLNNNNFVASNNYFAGNNNIQYNNVNNLNNYNKISKFNNINNNNNRNNNYMNYINNSNYINANKFKNQEKEDNNSNSDDLSDLAEDLLEYKTEAEQNEITNERKLQKIKLNLVKNPNVKVLKIEVLEGYEDFFSIHSVEVQ